MVGKVSEPRREKAIARDIRVLAQFISLFCRENHGEAPRSALRADGILKKYLAGKAPELCIECRRLLLHGAVKRALCPHDPKPRCKKCPDHCYAPGYRERIRGVMRFSGMHLIRRGRLDLLRKLLF
ncbi:MAG: nitrous oxide-stimulated promoter family protein [Spirochaetes bacterium]|nr:nitrous oxide-stimulated promoter family protein [Spirochaetota bacterium]